MELQLLTEQQANSLKKLGFSQDNCAVDLAIKQLRDEKGIYILPVREAGVNILRITGSGFFANVPSGNEPIESLQSKSLDSVLEKLVEKL